MKDDDDRGEEERDQVEQEKDVEKEEEKEEEEEEKEEDRDEVKSKKSTKESGYATPGSERPTRERKTVERYTVSSPDKFPRSSSIKALSIEKVHLLLCKFVYYFTFWVFGYLPFCFFTVTNQLSNKCWI